jgi:hypothetical protein
MEHARSSEAPNRPTVIDGGPSHARTRHSPVWGPFGLMLSMAIPVAVIVVGIAAEGPGAIRWLGAIVWGVVATVVFTLFGTMGKAMGMTKMDLLDLLGSAVTTPGSAASRRIGAIVHHTNGAILAVAWAFGAALIGVPADWATGLAWGVILWVLALLMMTTIGSVHPAIRRGTQEDPGPAALNLGAMTPVGSLMGHLVYGLVLGLAYQAWPLG